jgi:hypothetical protein
MKSAEAADELVRLPLSSVVKFPARNCKNWARDGSEGMGSSGSNMKMTNGPSEGAVPLIANVGGPIDSAVG